MFRGSITALITPFKDGMVDEQAFQRFVEWQISEGTHGLVPMGTTGESPTVSKDEHKRVIELCVEAAAGKVPVIAGTGSNNTLEAIHYTRFAKEAGADGVLIVAPYYNKPSQEGLYQHYKAVHDEVDVPIIVYNIPGRSVIDISVETMARLAKLPNIVGVKDATGSVVRIARQRAAIGEDFLLLSGDDPLALSAMANGGHGCISVTSNIAPKLCSTFQEACMAGDFKQALLMQDKLLPLHQALFLEPSPSLCKYGASRLGLCETDVRLPIVEAGEEFRKVVADLITDLGLVGPAG